VLPLAAGSIGCAGGAVDTVAGSGGVGATAPGVPPEAGGTDSFGIPAADGIGAGVCTAGRNWTVLLLAAVVAAGTPLNETVPGPGGPGVSGGTAVDGAAGVAADAGVLGTSGVLPGLSVVVAAMSLGTAALGSVALGAELPAIGSGDV
jgi:hypothetical protein